MSISKRQKKLENATEAFNQWLKKNYPADKNFNEEELSKLRDQAKFKNNTIHEYYRHHRSKIITQRRRWK
ncbi:MAG: hypothetical protein ACW990_00095 [Promethearchaeota archaeon]